jgi:DNA-binding PadR family transcriptional regulator
MTTEPLTSPDPAPDGATPALPRRFLRAFLLLALERDGESHGYELFECVSGRGLSVDMAGVYRDLRAMDQHDLVTSGWEPSDAGPDRRVYELTDAGRLEALEAADDIETIRDGLSAALDFFTTPVDRPDPARRVPQEQT